MRLRISLAAVLAAALALAACGTEDGATDAVEDKRRTVAAAFYPLAEISRAVGGERVSWPSSRRPASDRTTSSCAPHSS